MDSLLESLNSFDVSSHPNNPNAEHPHFSLYKSKPSRSSQEERRNKILEVRKESRYDLLNHLRNIEENICEDEENDEDMAIDESQPKHVYRKPREYSNFVMLSEWLVDVPQDFSDKYLAVLCPVGKRCLCVAYNGVTSVYAKNGRRIYKFLSILPGGSGKTYKSGTSVFDCVWLEEKKTFYVLDMMFWCKQSFLECDTVFRFQWLKSMIHDQQEELSTIIPINKYKFIPLPFFDCDKASLSSLLTSPFLEDVTLDGILFYHKDTHYTHGPSPLVCWLKSFMLPEILGVEIPAKYLKEKPLHYTNISSHIVEYDEERKERKERKFKKKDKMEVSCEEPEASK